MKSERLMELTCLLANHPQISAEDLARRLGVTERTIYRDIQSLSLAGIPIVSVSGKGGGYRVLDSFKIDRGVMKPEEFGSIVAGLKGLSTIVEDPALASSIEKFRALAPRNQPRFLDALFVELSPSNRVRDSLIPIRQALDKGVALDILYIGGNSHTTERRVDPLAVVFHWGAWYLYGWCHLRQDCRLFKILRIRSLRVSSQPAQGHGIDLDSRPWRKNWDSEALIPVVLRFFSPVRTRVEEEFDPSQVEDGPDGTKIVRTSLPEGDWLINWLLGFSGEVEVLSPPHLRQAIAERAKLLWERNSTPFNL